MSSLLEEMLENTVCSVVNWMITIGFELAMEKLKPHCLDNVIRNPPHWITTQPTIPEGTSLSQATVCRTRQPCSYTCCCFTKTTYLFDAQPGLSPCQGSRWLLASVVSFCLFYYAIFCAPTITQRAINRMSSVMQRAMLLVARCYWTVSHENIVVVSGIPSLALSAEERTNIYN